MKDKIIAAITALFIFVGSFTTFFALNIPPLKLKKDLFVYEYGVEEVSIDPATYITGSDVVVQSAQLNLADVKNEIGLYKASITYLNEEYPFYIKIVDTTKPVTKLKQVQVNVTINSIVVAKDLLVEIEDNSESVVYFVDDEEYVTQKQYPIAGTYVENIVVVDSSNNSSAQLRVKIVVGENNIIPILYGIDDVTISSGEEFDPLEGVRASDGKGIDITSDIKIISNDINIDEPGIYEVIYSVTNQQNNNIQRTRKITVE